MTAGQDDTFTRRERRKQIVAATVRVIAREGLSAASFSRIAAEAGLSSSGMISYHFANRDELLHEVVRFVLADFDDARRVSGGPSAAHDLDELLTRSVTYVHEHRERFHAMSRLMAGWKAPGQPSAFDLLAVAAPVQEILERGVRTGQMRALDCGWVAQCIQRSIETVHDLELAGQEPDVERFVEELRALWRAATATATGSRARAAADETDDRGR